MKIITASNGKKILKLSKVDWQRIGQKAGWGKSQEPEYLKIVPQHIRDQFIKEKGREPYYYELPKEIHDQQRELAEKEGSKIHQDHVRSRQNLMDFNAWMKIINVQGNMMYASKEFIDSVSDEQALILVNRILERSKNKSKTTFPYIQDFMIERIGADKFVELCANQLLEIPSKVAGLHKYDPTKKYWKQIVDKITIPNYINSWSDAISVHTDALYNITPEIINVIGMDNYIDLFIKASRRNSIVLSNIPDDVFNTLSANVIYKLWGQNISRKPRLITFIDDKVKEKIGFENYIKLWKLSLENDKFADVTRDNSVPEDVKPYVQEYFTVLESIKDKAPNGTNGANGANGANRGNSGNGGNGGNRGTPLFSSNKKTIKMSKVEWQNIGKKAGWMKEAQQVQQTQQTQQHRVQQGALEYIKKSLMPYVGMYPKIKDILNSNDINQAYSIYMEIINNLKVASKSNKLVTAGVVSDMGKKVLPLLGALLSAGQLFAGSPDLSPQQQANLDNAAEFLKRQEMTLKQPSMQEQVKKNLGPQQYNVRLKQPKNEQSQQSANTITVNTNDGQMQYSVGSLDTMDINKIQNLGIYKSEDGKNVVLVKDTANNDIVALVGNDIQKIQGLNSKPKSGIQIN